MPKLAPGFNPSCGASTASGFYARRVRPPPEGVRERVSLASCCTFELGGPARWLLEVRDESTLRAALEWSHATNTPTFVLGGGSNVVIDDAGFDGLVLHMALRGIDARVEGSRMLVHAAAGEPWDDFVAHTVSHEWAGLECLSGIPGLVGATPIQNVGAYGQDVSETIVSVRVFDPDTMLARDITPAMCAFGYRDSAFKHRAHSLSRCIVTSVTFALTPHGPPAVKYPELARALGEASPTLAHVRERVIALRRAKSMVRDPRDENRRSAGSFFTNVLLSPADADALTARAHALGFGDVPRFGGGEGRVKIPSAWLIERAGFTKGQRWGAIGISSRHALSLVHHGGGSSAELMAVAESIVKRVRDVFGVGLEVEPVRLRATRGDE